MVFRATNRSVFLVENDGRPWISDGRDPSQHPIPHLSPRCTRCFHVYMKVLRTMSSQHMLILDTACVMLLANLACIGVSVLA